MPYTQLFSFNNSIHNLSFLNPCNLHLYIIKRIARKMFPASHILNGQFVIEENKQLNTEFCYVKESFRSTHLYFVFHRIWCKLEKVDHYYLIFWIRYVRYNYVDMSIIQILRKSLLQLYSCWKSAYKSIPVLFYTNWNGIKSKENSILCCWICHGYTK